MDAAQGGDGDGDRDDDGRRRRQWLTLGQRIAVGGGGGGGTKRFRATVRYVGEVEGQSGRWIGLEWDDWQRGKHDGVYGGKRYFQCRRLKGGGTKKKETRGSLVREETLWRQQVDLGMDLEVALWERYQRKSGEGCVEVAGFEEAEEKLGCDGLLLQASCSGMNVSRLSRVSREMQRFLENVSELDVSNTLVYRWEDVYDVVVSLENLRVLNLSHNAMEPVPAARVAHPVPHLEVLVLNHCGIVDSYECLRKYLSIVYPNLKELYLFGNSISMVPVEEEDDGPAVGGGREGDDDETSRGEALALAWPQLHTLDLGGNGVSSWRCIARYCGSITSLRNLYLEDNEIAHVDEEDCKGCFCTLTHLNLGGNRLVSWKSVQVLGTLKSLRELRISHNPIWNQQEEISRIIAIARLDAISWLNGSAFTAGERRDCELAFLRELDRYAIDRDALLEERIKNLEHTYGITRQNKQEARGLASLSSGMIELHITHGGKETKKKVPSTFSHAIPSFRDNL